MNIHRPIKPYRVTGAFDGATLCMRTNIPLDNPVAVFRRKGDAQACETLRLIKATGCEVKILLHEKLAHHGEGHYEVVLMDDCEECGTFPVIFDANCYITSSDIETTKPPEKACGC